MLVLPHRLTGTLRDATRQLRRDPAPAFVIALTMAIGIAAATAIFTVARGVLLRPLPYRNPGSLVALQEFQPAEHKEQSSVASANLDRYTAATSFSSVTGFNYSELVVTGDADAERVIGAGVDRHLLATLGVAPMLGRGIDAGDDGENTAHVVVLSHEFWHRRFGADRRLIGRSIVIDDAPYTVVGVMPPSFEFPRNPAMDRDVELWVPRRRPPAMMLMRGVRDLTVVARLRVGVDRAQAQREMAAISERAESDNGQMNRGWRTRVVDLRDTIVGRVRPAIVMLGVCVAFLLLIACANASAATLARVTIRRQAFAVRLALGASNFQLVELVLAETIILALVAAAIALPLSALIRGVLVHLAPVAIPRQQGIVLDGVTLSFTAVVAIVAAVATALGPVRWVRQANVNALIADAGRTAAGSRSRSRAIAAFVFGQLALATVLIAMTANLYSRFARINRVDPGFTPQNVVAATIPLRGMRYRDARSRARLTTQLLGRVRAIPGVEHAAVGTLMPMSGGLMSGTYATRDAGMDSSATAVFRSVSSDFFQTLGIAIRQGRPIVSGDDEAAVPVAVVNEAFVRQTFGDRPAIGQRVRITPPGADTAESFEIVGVAGNAKEKDLLGPPSPIIYLSDRQASFPHTVLAVRSRGAAPLAAIRAAVRDLDPSLALDDVTPLAARVRSTYALQFFLLSILGAFALSAGVLISVGIYGSASYAVGADLKGIGIRMALGATRRRILWSVLSRTAGWSALGCAIGLVIAAALGRAASSVGLNVEPVTSVTGALAALVLAVCAAWLPAWRASGTDPLVVLRT